MVFLMKTSILLLAFSVVVHTRTIAGQEKKEASQTESQQTSEQAVQISGIKNQDWKSYKTMVKGLDVFAKLHSLSPQASPKFQLIPRKVGITMEGVDLRLVIDEIARPIALAEDGTFTLPRDEAALKSNAELVINSKKALYRWWPYVRSPQVKANQRRLGDLRMECEMFWAIYYDDIPFVIRNGIKAFGGPCHTAKIKMFFPSDFVGLKEARLIQNGRHFILPLSKSKLQFYIPIFDPLYQDDALIELDYENATEPLKRNYSGITAASNF
jgi:hypothetical protein